MILLVPLIIYFRPQPSRCLSNCPHGSHQIYTRDVTGIIKYVHDLSWYCHLAPTLNEERRLNKNILCEIEAIHYNSRLAGKLESFKCFRYIKPPFAGVTNPFFLHPNLYIYPARKHFYVISPISIINYSCSHLPRKIHIELLRNKFATGIQYTNIDLCQIKYQITTYCWTIPMVPMAFELI